MVVSLAFGNARLRTFAGPEVQVEPVAPLRHERGGEALRRQGDVLRARDANARCHPDADGGVDAAHGVLGLEHGRRRHHGCGHDDAAREARASKEARARRRKGMGAHAAGRVAQGAVEADEPAEAHRAEQPQHERE